MLESKIKVFVFITDKLKRCFLYILILIINPKEHKGNLVLNKDLKLTIN
jgi:hypothetical protein